jgi:glycine oxidase
MNDCCIVGGGIIGLSLARELAGRGVKVRVLARGRGAEITSWAAAGIFPPSQLHAGISPADALTAWSDKLHRLWSEDLRAETGIDNGLLASGSLHLARSATGVQRLRTDAAHWLACGTRADFLDRDGVLACEGALANGDDGGEILGGMVLREEMQLRPPRHLDALERSCRNRGVVIEEADVRRFVVRGSRVERAVTATGEISAGTWVLAAGSWSGGLASAFGLALDTRPIRGQIVLLRLPRPLITRIVYRGLDYLVQRPDGRLLVGSTLEDVGFDPTTTPDTVTRLLGVARSLLGELPGSVVERSWAGLRPGNADGYPSIGPIPNLDNAFMSAGHFRAGLHQSTGSAVLLADLMTGHAPHLDPAPFAPGRAPPPVGSVPPESTADYLARTAAADD